jgi:uncharacterized protein
LKPKRVLLTAVFHEFMLMPIAKKPRGDKPSAGRKDFARISALARAGKLDELKELLSSLTVTQPPHESLTGSLFFALTHKRDIEIVDLFFSKGVDPNVRWTRFTPMSAAAMCSSPKFVEMMIERGCDINYPAENGNSPLVACSLRGSENRNPAVRGGQEDVARLLIERGAKVDHANVEGKTALDYACHAISPTWEAMITLLLDAGARLEHCEKNGSASVVWASWTMPAELFKRLLTHGGDPNSRDASGTTPLMYAASYGLVDHIRTLLDCGARIDLKDHAGKSAFEYVIAENPRSTETLSLLREAAVATSGVSATTEQSSSAAAKRSPDQDDRLPAIESNEAKLSDNVQIFPDLIGTYRLDPKNTAALTAQFFHKRFIMKPAYDQAVEDFTVQGAQAPEIAGIRLEIRENQFLLTGADGEVESYPIAKVWEDAGRRFLEVDGGGEGPNTRFEVKLIGENSVHLSCDYDELGEFVWERIFAQPSDDRLK